MSGRKRALWAVARDGAGGRVPPLFTGEVISELKHRPEGIRVKHSVKGNSVKMYGKEGSVLRIETTINTTKAFKVYRANQGNPGGEKTWRPMQRSVSELWRRAAVSAAANRRDLESLTSVTDKTPVGQASASVCRAVVRGGRRHRALNPWSAKDAALLAVVGRGEHALNGLRNRDVRWQLWAKVGSARQERRRATGGGGDATVAAAARTRAGAQSHRHAPLRADRTGAQDHHRTAGCAPGGRGTTQRPGRGNKSSQKGTLS